MTCPCCVNRQGPQCCCVDNVGTSLPAGQQCAGSTFAQPNPPKTISAPVFEWCGMTAVRDNNPNAVVYYAEEALDYVVCDTTPAYPQHGPGPSYTQANRKYISASLIRGAGSGGPCGFSARYQVSVGTVGTAFKEIPLPPLPDTYYPIFDFAVGENYDVWIRACYDGSEPNYSVVLESASSDDTCGGAGCFDPCKFTPPEVTVVIAP